jgi:dihydrofolate synthase/folylpolyglutamate synthase
MRFNSLPDWLDWQQRLYPKEIELGLDRVGEVWVHLHQGPFPAKVISVAGTNGKGSCVAFLDAILRSAGYRTCCYTSPHLLRYNERIRIDGEEASDEWICEAFQAVDEARKDTPLTYFEFVTLAALKIFTEQRPDVVILEVGLGGRLDAVNIIDADLALITTINLDHADWLGDTRERIALEKAGILRCGKPAVYGQVDPPATLLKYAAGLGTELFVAGRDYGFRTIADGWAWRCDDKEIPDLPRPALKGGFQLENASAVLMALALLEGDLPIGVEQIRRGLLQVRLPGRFQILPGSTQTIIDVAHNPEAASALADNLALLANGGRTLAIFSVLSDKDIEQIAIPLKERIDHWYLFELEGERASNLERMTKGLLRAGVAGSTITALPSLEHALSEAERKAGERDRLVVFGSFLTVAAVLELRPHYY